MTALARKYRPKRFSDLLVQDHVAAALRGAVAGARVAHGYLFAGPPGGGKTTTAPILAMALNCERRGAAGTPRSEEHTSELQSPDHLLFRLLLSKKKKSLYHLPRY